MQQKVKNAGHGSHPAMQSIRAVLAEAESKCLGDLVGFGKEPEINRPPTTEDLKRAMLLESQFKAIETIRKASKTIDALVAKINEELAANRLDCKAVSMGSLGFLLWDLENMLFEDRQARIKLKAISKRDLDNLEKGAA